MSPATKHLAPGNLGAKCRLLAPGVHIIKTSTLLEITKKKFKLNRSTVQSLIKNRLEKLVVDFVVVISNAKGKTFSPFIRFGVWWLFSVLTLDTLSIKPLELLLPGLLLL